MRRRNFIDLMLGGSVISPLLAASCTNQRNNKNKDENKALILATATTGGTFYPVGIAISTLTNTKLAETEKITMNAINSAGSGENIQQLKNQEADLATLQGLFGAMAWQGRGKYENSPEKSLRSITMLWENVEHFVILKKYAETGNIEDLKNLKGQSFSIGKRNSGTEVSGRTILTALGLDVDKDFRLEYVGYKESSEALQNGRIAGMNTPAGIPVSAVTQAYAAMGSDQLAILEFTTEQVEKINRTYAVWSPYAIPAQTYVGQERGITSIAQPNFLAVRPEISNAVVYKITKNIYENLPFLYDIHKATLAMNLERAITGLPVPLHPGAVQYYEEVGLDISKDLLPKSI
ncbi:MAG: TAXI family TRAP transporter solute-binding subunit [Leptolyngbyaceae cyanobacterium MO_188.B28]|nr:TAXI family TRAP transporter solute-binding subunit [Leptolyngbyaceae cyanobacterium MO_188.B28]